MICPNCGKNTPTQTSYCINCNYKLKEDDTENTPNIPRTMCKHIVWVVAMFIGIIFSFVFYVRGDITKFVFIIDLVVFILLMLYPFGKMLKIQQ